MGFHHHYVHGPRLIPRLIGSGGGLLGVETDGLAIDFAAVDASITVRDTTTTSNAWTTANGDVQTFWRDRSFTSYASPSPKITRDSSGTYTYRPHNFVAASQKFKLAYWTVSNGTLTGDATTAPDNTTTAALYVPTAASGTFFRVTRSTVLVTATIPYTASFYVKANGYSKIHIMEDGFTNAAAVFDLSSVAVTATYNAGTFTVSNATITDVGNGWYRCSCTFNPTSSTGITLGIYVTRPAYASGDPMASAWTPDGTSGIYIWGAMLNAGPALLDYVPTRAHNICLQSADLATTWTNTNTTEATNSTAAPDGTTTADTIVDAIANGVHRMTSGSITTVAGLVYTGSVYVKDSTKGFAALLMGDTGATTRFSAVVNLTTGAITDTETLGSPTSTSSSITAVGNGWHRVSVSMAAPGTATEIQLCLSDSGTPTYANAVPTYNAADTTGQAYFWGAQVELASSPGKYVATTTAAVYSANYDLPREWDSAGACQGLLVEEARTNICLYARALTQSNYTKTSATAALTATGVGGTANTASTLTASGSNGVAYQGISSASAARSLSMFVKRRTGTGTVTISHGATTGSTLVTNGTFDTDVTGWTSSPTGTGAAIAWNAGGALDLARTDGSNLSRALQQITCTAGKLYRITVTAATANAHARAGTTSAGAELFSSTVTAGSTLSSVFYATQAAVHLAFWCNTDGATTTLDNIAVTEVAETDITSSINSSTWTRVSITNETITNPCVAIKLATSGDAIDVDYCQSEAGAFITSPIYTGSASVTRAADAITTATSVCPSMATAGTLYVSGSVTSNAGTNGVLALNDGTGSERIDIRGGSQGGFMSDGGATQAQFTDINSWTNATTTKCAVSFAANDVAWVKNSGTLGADTSATMPTFHTLRLGSIDGNASHMVGYLRQVMALPRAMTDAEIDAVTTL
jgi:hypothetical protein